jgi:nucleoside 2-deoxyribosyltransferase
MTMIVTPDGRLVDPDEPTPPQRKALQTVYEIFRRDGGWPTFQYVDTALDRDYELELADVASPLRPGLIRFDPHRHPASQVSLTVRGIEKCDGSRADLELFMKMLLWLICRQQEWRPSSPSEVEHLRLTSEEAMKEWWEVGYEPSGLDLLKALEMARVEGLTSFSSQSEDRWEVEPADELRKLRGVSDIQEYLARRVPKLDRLGNEIPVTWDLHETGPPAPMVAFGGPIDPEKQHPYVFILMPFEESWSDRVHAAISAACEQAATTHEALDWDRADDIAEPGRITDQIIAAIHRADAVIADITGRNANVLFELGFAHALGVPAIVINQEVENAPFDIKDWRAIAYQTDQLDKAQQEIARFLLSVFDSLSS